MQVLQKKVNRSSNNGKADDELSGNESDYSSLELGLDCFNSNHDILANEVLDCYAFCESQRPTKKATRSRYTAEVIVEMEDEE